MVVNVELGVSMGDDAAIYLCVILQHMIERLIAGALTSCGKPELRTKYGGTGKVVQPGADVQPRHLQDYIRTDKDMWSLFNSAFAFQVILSVFLDHASEMFFQSLGLPIHSKEALASCEYYTTVVVRLQQQKKSSCLPPHSNNSASPAAEQLLVTTPAQLAKVAAKVNPLCSLSPKACLMVEALTHETLMALCEGVVQRRVDTRVITIVDLEGGIRDVFPEGLAAEVTLAGKETISALSGRPALPSSADDGESADAQVRLCVRRLQGTRTLLRKHFRVSPGSLLFTVFSRACERLGLRETSVIFVHDGAVLSGRKEARTLLSAGGRVAQVFAVCKQAWACKQRAAARRGLLLGNGQSSHSGTQAGKKLIADDSAHDLREKPWRQRQHKLQAVAPRTRPAAKGTRDAAPHRSLLPAQLPPDYGSRSPPPGMGKYSNGQEVGGVSKPPGPRQSRRWIATPVEGSKLDLGRLENARDLFPLRGQRTGTFETGLSRSVSTGALAGSSGRRGAGRVGADNLVVSPRIERTVWRLSAMEACLRDLEGSMKELRSGDPNGGQSGISSVAMAAITSQLHVAYNLSSLCRQVLSSAEDGGEQQISQASQPAIRSNQYRMIATQGQVQGDGIARGPQRDSLFVTGVPREARSGHDSNTRVPSPAGKVPAAAPGGVSSSRNVAHDDGRAREQGEALARPARRTKTTSPGDRSPVGRGGAQTRPPVSGATASREVVRQQHQPAGVSMQRGLSSGSSRHASGRDERRREFSRRNDPHEDATGIGGVDGEQPKELEEARSVSREQDCTPEENTALVEEDVSSSWSSMISLGRDGYGEATPAGEATAAVPPEEAPSSWSSIVSEHNHNSNGHVGDAPPSQFPEESSAWSGYISEFQPNSYGGGPQGTDERGIELSGEGVGVATRNARDLGPSQGGGGGGRHAGLAMDSEYERRDVGAALGTTATLNAGMDADSSDGTDNRRRSPTEGEGGGGGGGGGQVESSPGLRDVIPLEVIPPSGAVLAPVFEPEAEDGDPCGDEGWDDGGDDAAGSWSSWLPGGGGGGGLPV
eukprot:g9067.t1